MDILSGLSFGAPWILSALLTLPAIWWLLRVTPPTPRRVVFPPLRLLLGLSGEEETPARTPWWLLALRLIAAACVIVAVADPLLGKAPQIPGSGPLILFIDNGWTAAANWDARKALIGDVLRSAARQRRAVAIVPTADLPDISLMNAGKAARIAQALTPQPWLPDRAAASAAIAHVKFVVRPEILWLSDGIEDGMARATATTLAAAGTLKIYADGAGKGPLALLPPASDPRGFDVDILRADAGGERSGIAAALGSHDETLAAARFHFEDGQHRATVHIVLPLEVRNKTARIAVMNSQSAGAVQLLGGSGAHRAVGIVSAAGNENEQPLLSDLYYLERALAPFADIRRGTVSDLLARNISVLILADIGKVAGSDNDRIAKFVAGGGLLFCKWRSGDKHDNERAQIGQHQLVYVSHSS